MSVIGSGAEHEARAEEVGRLLAERGAVVVLEPGWDVEGVQRIESPEAAVARVLAQATSASRRSR